MALYLSRRRALALGGKGLALAATAGAGIVVHPNESLGLDWKSLFGRKTGMEQPGRVKAIDGEAFADNARLQVGQEVRSGQQVSVSTPGSLVIVLHDNTIFRIYGGAVIELALRHMEQSILRLITGAIQTVIPEGNNFLVAGPTATIGVKGTVFYREVFGAHPPPGTTMDGTVPIPEGINDYFCTCVGSCEFHEPNTDQIFYTSHAEYHEAYFLDPRAEGQRRKAPMINHTDAQIRTLIDLQPGPKHDTTWMRH